MATSTRYSTGGGTMKAPEFTWDYVDGLSFQVATSVDSATVTAGNFEVQATGTLDNAGVDGWPATGHICINGRVYTYTSISGDTFVNCNGAYGDQADAAITAGEFGYQAVPAATLNMMIQMLTPGQVYQSSAQAASLNVTIAAFSMMDGTTEVTAYAGSTLALTDATTNYVYAYNNGGAAAVAKDTTSWASAAAAAGGAIIPLAKVTTAGGIVTALVEARPYMILAVPGGSSGTVGGSGTDNHMMRWDGTANAQDTGWVIADTTDAMTKDTGTTKLYVDPSLPLLTIQDQDGGGSSLIVLGEYSDSVARLAITVGGFNFGPGGASAADTSLQRSAADLLALGSGDALVIGSTAGDHASTTDGTISYDSTADVFRGRANGAWVTLLHTFSLAGDVGTPQSIVHGDTLTVAGGVGIDTTAGATDTITITFDATELDDITWGTTQALQTWTFDSNGADPTVAWAAGEVRFNSAHADVNFVVEGDTDTELLWVDAGLERVGISTNAPTHTLDVGGSFGPHALRTVSGAGPTTLDATDFVVLINLSGSVSHTLNLPAASGCTGRIYMLRRIDTDFTSTLTLEPNGTDAWEGTASGNTTIGVAGMIQIISDGSGWYMLSQS